MVLIIFVVHLGKADDLFGCDVAVDEEGNGGGEAGTLGGPKPRREHLRAKRRAGREGGKTPALLDGSPSLVPIIESLKRRAGGKRKRPALTRDG